MEPIWGPIEDPENPGLKVVAYYLAETHEYNVEASLNDRTLSEKFPAAFVPTFGIDVSDHAGILEIAEVLADKLVAEK